MSTDTDYESSRDKMIDSSKSSSCDSSRNPLPSAFTSNEIPSNCRMGEHQLQASTLGISLRSSLSPIDVTDFKTPDDEERDEYLDMPYCETMINPAIGENCEGLKWWIEEDECAYFHENSTASSQASDLRSIKEPSVTSRSGSASFYFDNYEASWASDTGPTPSMQSTHRKIGSEEIQEHLERTNRALSNIHKYYLEKARLMKARRNQSGGKQNKGQKKSSKCSSNDSSDSEQSLKRQKTFLKSPSCVIRPLAARLRKDNRFSEGTNESITEPRASPARNSLPVLKALDRKQTLSYHMKQRLITSQIRRFKPYPDPKSQRNISKKRRKQMRKNASIRKPENAKKKQANNEQEKHSYHVSIEDNHVQDIIADGLEKEFLPDSGWRSVNMENYARRHSARLMVGISMDDNREHVDALSFPNENDDACSAPEQDVEYYNAARADDRQYPSIFNSTEGNTAHGDSPPPNDEETIQQFYERNGVRGTPSPSTVSTREPERVPVYTGGSQVLVHAPNSYFPDLAWHRGMFPPSPQPVPASALPSPRSGQVELSTLDLSTATGSNTAAVRPQVQGFPIMQTRPSLIRNVPTIAYSTPAIENPMEGDHYNRVPLGSSGAESRDSSNGPQPIVPAGLDESRLTPTRQVNNDLDTMPGFVTGNQFLDGPSEQNTAGPSRQINDDPDTVPTFITGNQFLDGPSEQNSPVPAPENDNDSQWSFEWANPSAPVNNSGFEQLVEDWEAQEIQEAEEENGFQDIPYRESEVDLEDTEAERALWIREEYEQNFEEQIGSEGLQILRAHNIQVHNETMVERPVPFLELDQRGAAGIEEQAHQTGQEHLQYEEEESQQAEAGELDVNGQLPNGEENSGENGQDFGESRGRENRQSIRFQARRHLMTQQLEDRQFIRLETAEPIEYRERTPEPTAEAQQHSVSILEGRIASNVTQLNHWRYSSRDRQQDAEERRNGEARVAQEREHQEGGNERQGMGQDRVRQETMRNPREYNREGARAVTERPRRRGQDDDEEELLRGDEDEIMRVRVEYPGRRYRQRENLMDRQRSVRSAERARTGEKRENNSRVYEDKSDDVNIARTGVNCGCCVGAACKMASSKCVVMMTSGLPSPPPGLNVWIDGISNRRTLEMLNFLPEYKKNVVGESARGIASSPGYSRKKVLDYHRETSPKSMNFFLNGEKRSSQVEDRSEDYAIIRDIVDTEERYWVLDIEDIHCALCCKEIRNQRRRECDTATRLQSRVKGAWRHEHCMNSSCHQVCDHECRSNHVLSRLGSSTTQRMKYIQLRSSTGRIDPDVLASAIMVLRLHVGELRELELDLSATSFAMRLNTTRRNIQRQEARRFVCCFAELEQGLMEKGRRLEVRGLELEGFGELRSMWWDVRRKWWEVEKVESREKGKGKRGEEGGRGEKRGEERRIEENSGVLS